MRVLFYAVNGLGLGHVTRLLGIARELRQLSPGIQVLFLTSSEADSVIYKEGFPAVKVPSKNISRESGLKSNTHIRILQETAWSIFSSFNPHVTVVDTFPQGFAFELEPVFNWDSTKFVFIYRQRRAEKALDKRFQAALQRYGLIIVPHEKDEFGIELPRGVKALFTGNTVIRRRNELVPRERVLDNFDLPREKKNLLITLGGGGQEGMNGILQRLLDVLGEYPGIQPVLAQGNLLRSVDCATDLKIIRGYYPICELYNGFDYVVAACGYNTVGELLYFNKPALYLPFERTVDDQYERARTIQDAGLGVCADPDDITSIKKGLDRLFEDDVYTDISDRLKKVRKRNNSRRAARAILRIGSSR